MWFVCLLACAARGTISATRAGMLSRTLVTDSPHYDYDYNRQYDKSHDNRAAVISYEV